MKILYVEDELEAREALSKYLKRRYGKIFTAVDGVDVILKSVDVGINKYLLKPIKPEELIGAISEYLESIVQKQKTLEPLEGENKKQIEDKIKKEFTSFLKNTTGRGPSGVSVFINYDKIEIKAFDAITVMEKNMIDNNQNSIIIEQYRKLFYSINEDAICNMVQEIIGSRVKFKQIDVYMDKKINKIELQVFGELGK